MKKKIIIVSLVLIICYSLCLVISLKKNDNKDDVIVRNNEEYKTILITESGEYNLNGKIVGNVVVNTNGKVKLVLDNVNIKSSNEPAILIEQAEEVEILIKDNTKNILEDSNDYKLDNETIDSVIYSEVDLIISGNGSLKTNANYKNGIVSNKNLKIISGSLEINSVNEGIISDNIQILSGNIIVKSNGDSIKSSNDILIENGTFYLLSNLDAIQTEKNLVIKNGKFDIRTTGDIRDEEISSKGLKASNEIIIENGDFKINTTDDSINSKNYLEIKNGKFKIDTLDDAIKSDIKIIIDNGVMKLHCKEGIESGKIIINNGDFNILSSNDGINVKEKDGGNNGTLIINNGNFIIDSYDDGIDVNGNGYVYGGNIIIDALSDINVSSIDFEDEFIVDGGNIIALSSNDMLEIIKSNKQYNLIVDFKKEYKENTKIKIIDSNNQEIISYNSLKDFEALTISSSKFIKGNKYRLELNDLLFDEFVINSNITLIGLNKD